MAGLGDKFDKAYEDKSIEELAKKGLPSHDYLADIMAKGSKNAPK